MMTQALKNFIHSFILKYLFNTYHVQLALRGLGYLGKQDCFYPHEMHILIDSGGEMSTN